jgi:pimeloyl-ACP methyl ester carboxylesterase
MHNPHRHAGPCQVRSALLPVSRRAWSLSALVILLVGMLCGTARAQLPKVKLPPKQEVMLVTEDEVLLKASFWPGTGGKETVPVILLHAFRGTRQDFNTLAEFLQGKGCAVIAPDLRGHGDSTQVRDGRRPLAAAEMSPPTFSGMIEDVETVKRFLMARNNSGELNIDKLCMVGAEMGAIVAANWAITDWGWPPLAVSKQGQDVKAIVLISPPEKFKMLRIFDPLNDRAVRTQISFYIAVGNRDSTAVRDATKIYNTLKRFHPPSAKGEDQDLFFDARIPTTLQGTKLLGKDFKQFGLANNIAEFIEVRAAKQPYEWRDRKLP